jgi:hypothetical protein
MAQTITAQSMSADDFAMLIDAMDGHSEEWIAAVIADAAKLGVSVEEIDAAWQRLNAPLHSPYVQA